MVTDNHYRWDFIMLSTDTKPTPATSKKVTNGSTLYTSDDSKLYVWYKDQWYEKTATGGGGGTTYTAGDGITIADDTISVDTNTIQPKLTAGTNITITDNVISASGGGTITPVQSTGTSTSDVMSQNAVTSMIYADASTPSRIRIGNNSNLLDGSIAIGRGANAISVQSTAIGDATKTTASSTAVGYAAEATQSYSVAIGFGAKAGHPNSIGFAFSNATRQGEMALGLVGSQATQGYNNTAYRLISGVHDGQGLHDVATVAQGNTLSVSAPTTSTVGVLGQLWTDTTNMHTYQLTAISGDIYTWTQRW